MRRTAFLAASLAVATTVALVGSAPPGSADRSGPGGQRPPVEVADPAAACAALAGAAIDPTEIALPTRGAVVLSADLVAAAGATPEHCRVRGQVLSVDAAAPPISFQLNLPTTWVRRTTQLGGGGFNGTVVTGTGNVPGGNGHATPLQRHHATFGSDGGSAVAGPAGSFGLNAEAFANYSGESVKKTRDAAQFLIEDYYGTTPRQQYFAGGSKGGQEALMAAHRYGADYDGIISYFPASEVLRMTYRWDVLLRDSRDVPGGGLNAAEQQVAASHIMASCDGLDGATDGLIADRDGCDATLDLTEIACPGGADTGDDCLSATQIATLEASGESVPLPYPAADGGTEARGFPFLHGANLADWMAPYTGYDFFNDGVIKFWYLKDPTATLDQVRNFDWVANRSGVEEVTDESDLFEADIDRFLSGGGKLILVHGTTDTLIPPSLTDEYHERLVKRYGHRLARSVRYYTQPGYGHGTGVFNLSYDSLTALEQWVRDGVAPKDQVAHAGSPAGRSLPLCEFPAWPQYDGVGDQADADSYACVEFSFSAVHAAYDAAVADGLLDRRTERQVGQHIERARALAEKGGLGRLGASVHLELAGWRVGSDAPVLRSALRDLAKELRAG